MQEASGRVAGVLRMSGEVVQPSRVLVVRSGPLRDRVAAAIQATGLNAEVEVSPSYLSAMGWLTRERVDVIIGPVSAMTGMVGSTARALRRLAPGTRLIIVAELGEKAEATAALSAGFDDCVYEPADATALLSVLRLVRADPTNEAVDLAEVAEVTAERQAAGETTAASVVVQSDAGPQTPQADRTMIKPDLLGLALDDAKPIELRGEVGDIDLAEAVLRKDGTLVPLAVRLMRKQSGVADLTYTPIDAEQSADIDDPVVSVDVMFGGKVLGRLGSSMGDQEALTPWAGWLSRWVALEDRQRSLYEEAMRDELTGLWNRRYFDRFLDRLLRHASQGRQQVTLMVFDIDDFKKYNDKFGHPAGDAILRSAATLMQSVVREHDVVARIGGDEFAVVFWDKGEPRHLGSQHPDNVIGIAKRFQKAICEHRFPELGEDAVGRLTVSGGLAGFPWDGRTPAELLDRADKMALQSKRQGKNVICFGPGAAPNGNGGHG